MNKIFTLILLFSTSFLSAQIDFEEFNLSSETYLDGSDGSGGFTSGNIFLPNSYYDDGTYAFWSSGWVISNTTDVVSMAQSNESSAITGGGADGSETYAVATAFSGAIMNIDNPNDDTGILNLSITNSTLAYQTMLNGGSFGQKTFGGLTGDDPDFFLLTIKGFKNGALTTDSVDLYLADYRFEDNSQDYILNEWVDLDISTLWGADSLIFTLTSSDVNQFGMLTPAYFCMDNVVLGTLTPTNALVIPSFEIFPNPATEFITLNNVSDNASCAIYDLQGRLVYNNVVTNQSTIDVRHFTSGTYVVKVTNEERVSSELVVVE